MFSVLGEATSARSFIAALKTCASKVALEQGKLIHSQVVKNSLETNIFIVSTLIGMYSKCGSITDANVVFSRAPNHDVVSWSAMIAAYAEHGHGAKALHLYDTMQDMDLEPTEITFASVLKACTDTRDLGYGHLVNIHIIRQGKELNAFVGSALVNMYNKCGSFESALYIFDGLPNRNVVSWSAAIAGHIEWGHCEEALLLFWRMLGEGINPDEVTYVFIIKSCSILKDLANGNLVHSDIVERGIPKNLHLACSLTEMYGKCGSLEDGKAVFDEVPKKSEVLWSVMIGDYVHHSHGEHALHLFGKMLMDGTEPNTVAFIWSLKACSCIDALHDGMLIHASIVSQSLDAEEILQNALTDMYMKCACFQDAKAVFTRFSTHDVVSWSTMIVGYVENGCPEEALDLFKRMLLEGIETNKVTYPCIIKACTCLSAIKEGNTTHSQIVMRGLEDDVFVGNTLVDMYAKCSNIEEAECVFYNMPEQDDVSWNTIIAAHADVSHGDQAISMFYRMVNKNIMPNEVTFACVLKACSSLATRYHTRLVHKELMRQGFECKLFVVNSLIDAYAKSASLEDAYNVFERSISQDVVTWNAIVSGYSEHGYFKMAEHLLENMQLQDVEPDDLTLLSILLGCSHMGLLREGFFYLRSGWNCGLYPKSEHFACVVDILGRAGCFNEAEDCIMRMPYQPDLAVWAALLGSCSKYENVNVGARAFAYILEANSIDTSCFVQMSNICTSNTMNYELYGL